MHRFLALFSVGAAVLALSSAACGDSNKPPLTPDSEHPDLGDAGAPPAPPAAPAAPAAPASAAPAKK